MLVLDQEGKLSRGNSCKFLRGEPEFIFFHLLIIILLDKPGVLFLLVCAKLPFGSSERRLMERQYLWEHLPLLSLRGPYASC